MILEIIYMYSLQLIHTLPTWLWAFFQSGSKVLVNAVLDYLSTSQSNNLWWKLCKHTHQWLLVIINGLHQLCIFLIVYILFFKIGVINDSAFSVAFKEWKFCNHEINLLQFKDFMVCPTCATYQHSAHVDGNAKLYRYKSAGE